MKPPTVNQRCVVYSFTCDLCDADYVGYTARCFYQRIVECKYSVIGKHFMTALGDTSFLNENQLCILKKCMVHFQKQFIYNGFQINIPGKFTKLNFRLFLIAQNTVFLPQIDTKRK